MFRPFESRWGHFIFLLAAGTALFLPNLGKPSLWDIDEGNNAEAAREMLVSGDWIVPTFNYQLRVDKPALLYWCQIAAYRLFGVNEFAARLPSALAALAAVLLTYELGRRMFGAAAGLLAGLVLASAALFCAAAHFANPDALLNACTVLMFLFFWRGYSSGSRSWFAGAGFSTGLGFLAKGPVSLVLPGAVILLFLLWARQLRLLLDRRLLLGMLCLVGVALPWFALVGVETKGEFLRGFFLTHNQQRFLSPMEGHHGPIYYHLISLLIGFAPWSVFLGPVAIHTWRAARNSPSIQQATADAHRFLVCWIIVYFVVFSLSATKLPNYILPLYPAAALLTASFLDAWRRGAIVPTNWIWRGSFQCLFLIGIGAGFGLVVAGGVIDLPMLRGHRLPGLEAVALVGLIPVIGATVGWWLARRQQRRAALTTLLVSAVLFIGSLAAWGGTVLDSYKAPRSLVRTGLPANSDQEIRIGCYEYFQPSLVFYCRREVARFSDDNQVVEFLQSPWPVFLFVPEPVWRVLEAKADAPHRLLSRHWDLYRRCEVVVVTNR